MSEPSTASANDPAKQKTARALASYAYFDLQDSLAVAKAIHDNAGGSCTLDQLASYLKYKSTSSGTFQTRLSAAKQFGFVRAEGAQIVVTDRAMQIISPVMPEDAINAKADAFLGVGLFGKVYEKFKGTTIPPKVGLRNLFMTSYGISTERVDPAVRVLMDSAEQAGFFPQGDQSRLVRPAVKPQAARTGSDDHPKEPPAPPRHSGGGGDGPTGVHPAIVGLLRELPPAGSKWPKKAKERFVKAFLASLEFVYPDDDDTGEPS